MSFIGTSSSEYATVEVPAVNNGTVAVHEGTLTFGGGTGSGADSGAFTVAAGTTLDLGGTRTEASGATISGAGEVDITGTATFTAASNLAITGAFDVSGALVVASGVNVITSNLTLDGTLEGPGKLTVTGPATLGSGGDVLGSMKRLVRRLILCCRARPRSAVMFISRPGRSSRIRGR